MHKVLIQDAEIAILEVMTIALESEGFIVQGRIVCDLSILDLIDHQTRMVILDYRFNGNEAVSVCREIKIHYPFLPVLVMSCNSNIEKLYHLSGFDGYIKKPFDLDQLYAVLHRYIDNVS